MFTKTNKESERKPVLPITPAPPSLLSTDLKVIGNLHSEGEIQVDGAVEGDIDANILVIGETAEVNGEVTADVVRVHGFVTGQIKARSVSLAKTAHVQGDILHESLAIEQGAFLEGHCRRVEDSSQRKKDAKKDGDGGINILGGGAKNKVEASEAAE